MGEAASGASPPQGQHIVQLMDSARREGRPFFSLEFFPPKTSQGLANLYLRIARMVGELDPAWIQITWGAGGSTQSTSLELAGRVQKGALNVEARSDADPILARNACLHLTCTNVTKESLDQTLNRAIELGICNILALRGDPPRGQEYWIAADERFQHATDLIKYIRQRHGNAFCIGVAGYPELHPDADSSMEEVELDYMLEKEKAGADFVVTQLFYDVEAFLTWYRRCREKGLTIPIVPGVMPIQNYQSFRRVTSLCKAKVPQHVWYKLDPARFDDAAVRNIGVDLAKNLMERIMTETDICGFHFCTLNLEKSTRKILESLQWAQGPLAQDAAPIPIEPSTTLHGGLAAPGSKSKQEQALKSQIARAVSMEGGPLSNSIAEWDEFPNGRYGDARSPAFGQIDGYGVSLKVPPADALKLWGSPTTEDEVCDIFVRYLQGQVPCIPWCDCPILPETEGISSQLIALNARPSTQSADVPAAKGWWTVGSQPSVDGIDSADPKYGFGPAQGYIFQKAFVEFFATYNDMRQIAERIEEHNKSDVSKGAAVISYFAGNRAGELHTNVSKAERESCAVTWGCFVGKEVVQSTIIEQESFEAWRDEAFAIWSEWELLFPLKSPTRKLLHDIGEQRWLVTVIHHDYKDEAALWRFLGVL